MNPVDTNEFNANPLAMQPQPDPDARRWRSNAPSFQSRCNDEPV